MLLTNQKTLEPQTHTDARARTDGIQIINTGLSGYRSQIYQCAGTSVCVCGHEVFTPAIQFFHPETGGLNRKKGMKIEAMGRTRSAGKKYSAGSRKKGSGMLY